MPKTLKLQTVRVLSYNIHQGLTVYKRQIALSMLLKALKADIVLLQEVAGVQGPGKKKDRLRQEATSYQLEALADEIWPYHAYGRNSVFSGGFHGNAILSRFPILRFRNIDISIRTMIRRGMLHAELQVPAHETPLHVISTHLGLLQVERQRQVKQLVHYVHKAVPAQGALLVGGDFNDWRERISKRLHRTLHLDEAFLQLHARHPRTFPSRFPVLPLDRIYYRGARAQSAHRLRGRPWLFLSDHLPLVADFQLG
jgi:endonuclease/exonuclease/phosphatase family metal-dependent hydrolase